MKLFTAHYERANITTGKRLSQSFSVQARNKGEAEAKARRHVRDLHNANNARNTHRYDLLASYRLLYVIEETGPDQ